MKADARFNKFHVVGIGDLVSDLVASIDHFPIESGSGQYVGSFDVQPGGMGNFLIAGARIGMDMTALGAMGKDVYSEAALLALLGEGVRTEHIRLLPEVSSKVVLTLVAGQGQHVFLSYEGGSIEPISLDADWVNVLKNVDALLVLGYALNETYLQDVLQQAIQIVKDSGGLVFFDPGPKILETSDTAFEWALRRSNVMLATEDELEMVMSRADIPAVKDLISGDLSTICVKLGSAGCRIIRIDQDILCPGYQVEVRDTSGAGDSFAAAFIFGCMSGWNPDEIGVFANAMGAAKVAKHGTGRNVPTMMEIHELLASQGIEIPNK